MKPRLIYGSSVCLDDFVFLFEALELAPTRFDRSKGRLCDGVSDPMGFHSPNLLEDGYASALFKNRRVTNTW